MLLFTDRKGRLIGEADTTGVDGAEQPGQDEYLEDNVGLDDEGAEDEEDLAEEIEIADQVQSEVADGDQVKADAEGISPPGATSSSGTLAAFSASAFT